MSSLRPSMSTHSQDLTQDARLAYVRLEDRRASRSDRLASGTLACRHCDAPVAAGAQALSLAATLRCPFCLRRGPVRDFLSLATPGRPARVTVRVGTGENRGIRSPWQLRNSARQRART